MKTILRYSEVVPEFGRTYFLSKIINETKIHTIRSGKYRNLLFPIKAHHVIAGRPDMEKPVVTELTGFQELEIIHVNEDSDAYKTNGYSPILVVDGHLLNKDEAFTLSLNDGFASWDHFKKWFDKDQDRIILHFTWLRYGSKTVSS